MKKLFLIFAIMYCYCTVSAQEKIYMPYFEVINIHKDYQLATTRLLKTYLETNNKTELVLPVRDTAYYSENREQALIKAKSLKINNVLIGELNRVGETVIISITLYKTETGEKTWNTILKASSPDDLDPVMQKIASSINNRNTVKNSEDIYNVTDYNSKQLNKMVANTFLGIEIGGGATFINTPNKFPAGFGIIYSGDLRTILFDVKGCLYFSDVSMYNINIQINYPLLNKLSSPFVGGGLGYGYTSINSNDQNNNKLYEGNGLTLFAGAGYIFNRTSNINLRCNASLFFSMYEVNSVYPSGLLLGVSVLF